jgi:uncharacterized membrane protein (DUF485 family)
VRRRHQGFVARGVVVCLAGYLVYAGAVVVAPGWMGMRVVGPVDVGMAAALVQVALVFRVAGAYVRHARRWRDGAAPKVRWEMRERSR